ncbi:STAS domain protein [Leptospira yanagawae serovar Saopaulo str. Sao Paulo = ATCC 700523]|uniref:STAS domain protein n=1 Tax=Leptospira yanagawae serovar Saopaulo str. Sao Paulo = ATCC 700523 TaxID=1249483 RepID=A0A5E8H8E3_9LEPT|nr:STAS domain-containing protein [Leptospira yanagawae]EOQ87605.1 STAS domain protein [Leptospira yanagawae serovar Saopaulo str. Sao Paulo = ATCC 700523]
MESKDKVFSIQLKGGLDGSSAEDFYRYFESQLNKGYRKFLFQLGALDYVTSNGISILIKIHKQILKSNAVYAIYGLKAEVEDVLKLVGLFDKLPVFRSHHSAESFLLQVDLSSENNESNHPNDSDVIPNQKGLREEQTPNQNQIRFYFTGKSKGEGKESREKEPVSKLESLPSENKAVQMQNPSMETVLEEKINQLRLEIKDSLQSELERRFSVYKSGKEPEANLEKIPSYIQSKTKQLETVERIIQCEVCGTRLRLFKFGKHECPSCKTQFQLSPNGSIRFLEKLNPI